MDDEKFVQKSMGIVLKRRDNANIVKKIYGGIIDIILNEQNIQRSIEFLKSMLQKMMDGKCDMEDFIITKSLRDSYKDPTKIAHKVLAERIGEREPGNKPNSNDRIPYVYIETEDGGQKVLQGERIETPEYVKRNDLKIDYKFYITNQIMNPVLQLLALVLEQIPGYEYPASYFQLIEKHLLEEYSPLKTREKIEDIRAGYVKELLFNDHIQKLESKKIRRQRILTNAEKLLIV